MPPPSQTVLFIVIQTFLGKSCKSNDAVKCLSPMASKLREVKVMYSGGSITAAEKGVIKNDILSPFPTSSPALSLIGSSNLKGYLFHAFF
jgi:hypothetical protein